MYYDPGKDLRRRSSAKTILTYFLHEIYKDKISSVIDVGCYNGIWLEECSKLGISRIVGIDAPYIKSEWLVIPESNFYRIDLESLLNSTILDILVPREKYDLCINLEVAEHLSYNCSFNLVKFLTSLSNTILFSAATPDQGGDAHINTQKHTFWIELFNSLNYKEDNCLQYKFNDDKVVFPWYNKNIFIFRNTQSMLGDVNMAILPVNEIDNIKLQEDTINEIKKKYSQNNMLNLDEIFEKKSWCSFTNPLDINQSLYEQSVFLDFLLSKNLGKCDNILEIGFENGGTAYLFSHICHNLISVDISKLRIDVTCIEKNLNKYTYVEGNSRDIKTLNKVKKVLDGKSLDVLFIDGDHSYNGVSSDFYTYSPLVKSGGVVAFHDVHEDLRFDYSTWVTRFWEEVIKVHHTNYVEIVDPVYRPGYGIGYFVK